MRPLHIITVATLLLLAGACADGGGSGDHLVVYSGRSEELVEPLIDDFRGQTGIEVEVRYGDSPELAATLLEEGEDTDVDVFYAQDPASLGAVAAMLAPLPAEITDQVDPRFADRESRWVGTSGRVRTFIYSTETEIDLPQTIDEVVDPRWAGQLGIAPTNGSFLAFVAAMISERGEEATLSWLTALADNDPVDYPGNTPIVAAVDAGEIEGGLVNHYYIHRLRAEGAGADAENWFIPAGDVGSLVMPAGAGMLEGTDVPDAARQFVEFLLSQEAQEYFATETFEFPMIDGVPPPAGLPELGEIASPDIDLSGLADLLDDATRLVTEAGLV